MPTFIFTGNTHLHIARSRETNRTDYPRANQAEHLQTRINYLEKSINASQGIEHRAFYTI